MLSDPFKGIWWPPTRKWKGHFESHGHFLRIGFVFVWFLTDCTMMIHDVAWKSSPSKHHHFGEYVQGTFSKYKQANERYFWNNRPLDRTKNYTHADAILFRWSFPKWPTQKNPKAPWSSLKAILLRCGVSLCDGHWFGWISESPWQFKKKVWFGVPFKSF